MYILLLLMLLVIAFWLGSLYGRKKITNKKNYKSRKHNFKNKHRDVKVQKVVDFIDYKKRYHR